MPAKKEHVKFGIGTSIATESVQMFNDHKKGNKVSIKDVFIHIGISGIFGAFGSLLPDKLEPAKSFNHRSLFHSIIALCAVVCGLFLLFKSKKRNYAFSAIKSTGVGYASHLAQDSKTPKGLPLIG